MMSKLLRHTPEDFGVVLDPGDGTCSISTLLAAIQAQSRWSWVKQEDIEQVVRNSDKQRFEMKAGRIKANHLYVQHHLHLREMLFHPLGGKGFVLKGNGFIDELMLLQ